MSEWWSLLNLELRVFYTIALASSLLLVIQALMTLFGFGDDADPVDDAGDGSGLHILSVRTVIAFLVGFGWTGVMAIKAGMSMPMVILTALLVGGIFMLAVFALMRSLYGFRQSGTLDYENAVGKTGTVYLTVPAKSAGPGQIEVMVQGRLKIVQAYTKAAEPIPTRTKVKVVGLLDKQSLLVEPIA